MHTIAQSKKASCTLFLLTATSILPKRSVHVKNTPESTIDFHLEIVKQIDELLKDTSTTSTSSHAQPIEQRAAHVPCAVETRSPITGHPGREDTTFDPTLPLRRPHPIPDEFKADFPVGTSPAFRFVTSLDPLEDLGFKRRDDRIEIIDLATLRGTPVNDTTPASTPHHSHEDIVFLSAMTKTEDQDMDQTQLYNLQGKSTTDEKHIDQNDRDLSYLPVDLTERVQQIKEREQAEERPTKKTTTHKKETTTQQTTETKPKKKPKTTKTEQIIEPLTKKQQKLAERQAKLEERKQQRLAKLQEKQQKKEEKQQQKEEKQRLKEEHKHDHDHKQPKPKKTKDTTKTKEPHSLFGKKKQTTPQSLEIDEDLIKFLQLTDTLLGQLPDNVIDQFAHSDDFQLYEKIMTKYHVK